jgi:hypothetical protein
MTILTRKEMIESVLKSVNAALEKIPVERREAVCAEMLNSIAGIPVVYVPGEKE